MPQWVKNLTVVHEDAGLIPSPTQWVKDLVLLQAAIAGRCGLNLVLLWLWCSLACAAVAPIPPLPWKLPHAKGEERKQERKEEKGRKRKEGRERKEGRQEERRKERKVIGKYLKDNTYFRQE